jgi:hypothetical protein
MNKKTHLIIPDTQIRLGVGTEYLKHIGKYIVEKKPDVIIQLGDWADMRSLSSYDAGKKAAEGVRYVEDIAVAQAAMEKLLTPMEEYNKKRIRLKKTQYKPKMVLTLGNHENRINRHVEANPLLEGKVSTKDLGYEEFGFEVYPFLTPVIIDGIKYSHYFPRGANGRIMQTKRGAPSARAQVMREGMSCTAGHLQSMDFHALSTGVKINYGLIVGSCYTHEEEYLSPQGTEYWRGIVLKNNVRDGQYSPIFVELDYLKERYNK